MLRSSIGVLSEISLAAEIEVSSRVVVSPMDGIGVDVGGSELSEGVGSGTVSPLDECGTNSDGLEVSAPDGIKSLVYTGVGNYMRSSSIQQSPACTSRKMMDGSIESPVVKRSMTSRDNVLESRIKRLVKT
jgi:hypothetical protein